MRPPWNSSNVEIFVFVAKNVICRVGSGRTFCAGLLLTLRERGPMFLHRWFVLISIVVALPSVAAQALARKGGHATPADDVQMRELLAKLAAASGEVEPEERTEADLMYEAMLRWNGEPPGSAAIDRALAQSKKDAARTKRATVEKVRSMFWKDPFADDPHKLIPVRQEDRDLLSAYNRGRHRSEVREARHAQEPRDEVSRLRAALEAAREEAAAARAETARLREGGEAMSEPRSCVADASARSEPRKRRRSGPGRVHSHHTERTQIALTSTVTVPARAADHYQARVAPTPPAPPVAAPPPAHGIIVTPLPSPSPPVIEAGRRQNTRIR
jgi:hypothetical protein